MEHLEAASQRYAELLDHLLEAMGKVGVSLAGFRRYVQKLHVFCTSTRIESSRLGGSDIGFDTLSDDIHKLAVEIEAKSALILVRLETLNMLIRENLRKVLDLEDRQRGGTRTILDLTRASLRSLEEKNELSRAAARGIAASFGDLSGIIGEIVSSIQFHDITRQQMEHVAESLRQVGGELSACGFSSSSGDICELQAIQLRHACSKLTEAVCGIIENLGATARKVEDMSRESLRIAGDERESDSSSLSCMEERISLIASALGDYGKADIDLAAAMNSITGAVADMSVFVGDIERIGVAMKLIALNAVVKAAHIGEEGAALGVIADAIHNLSFETGQETRVITDVFKSVIAYGEQLFSGAKIQAGPSGETVEEMASGVGQLTAAIREANGDVASNLALLEKAGKDLLSGLHTTATGICVHQRVAGAADRIASNLDETAVRIRGSAPEAGGVNADRRTELLKELEKSYTMNSERQIHRLATAAEIPDLSEDRAGVAGADGGETAGDDFGDNVELF